MAKDESKDFFISYNKADRGWAEWIAWQLESEGFSTIIQAWDFRPGGNFVLQMNEAIKNAKRTIAVLSPSYLASLFTQPEWADAFANDPTGTQGKLLPIRVRDCALEGLLKQIVYIDLVGLDKIAACNALRAGVRQSRALPSIEPLFPGDISSPPSPAPSFPGEWPELWHVPYPRNPFFTGCEELLTHLHEHLSTTKPTALSRAMAISGLGGIGKTQIALEYIYRYDREYRYILWANAATEDLLRTEMIQLAAHLHITSQHVQDQEKIIEALKQWLAQQNNWLLILDNADDLEMASKYIPRNNKIQGHVLLITRASTTGALAKIVEVEKMEQDEGILLLLRRAHLLDMDDCLNESSKENHADAQAIVIVLDGLPLAIDQAGAYIEETNITLSTYLTLYQTRRKELLSQRGQLPPGHPDAVAITWDLSFQQVLRTNPPAADLLRLCAFLAPDAIPETIITTGTSSLGEWLGTLAIDPLQLNAAIQTLRQYSLIKRNQETKTLNIHRLVQAVLEDVMNLDEQQAWAEKAVRAVSKSFPIIDSGTWRNALPYLSHASRSLSFIEQYQMAFPEVVQFLDAYGHYFQYTAHYEQAEPLYQRSLQIKEQFLEPEHPYIAYTLHQLARIYQEQVKYELAEPLYQRALHIYEKVLGSEHPSTGSTLHALAWLYQEQGKYEQAESLYQRALHIGQTLEGPEHPSTGSTLHQLACLYHKQDKYEQAESLYQRALHICEQNFGPKHPDTGNTVYQLAWLYHEQGKYKQAEPLYRRVLSIYEQSLRPEHPNTGSTVYQLAWFYHEQGEYEQAELFYQRALRIYEQNFGLMHPSVGTTLCKFAWLYHEQGKYEQAEPLYQRASLIYEQSFGFEHPSTGSFFHQLARFYQDQGKYEQAESLYQRALHIYEQSLGSEHPEISTTLNNMAYLYRIQERYQEAEPLFQRSLAIKEKTLGPEHLRTVLTLENYADLLRRMHRSEEAAPLETRAKAIRAKQQP